MNTLRELLGPTASLAHIRPPGPSYAEWHRFLREAEEAGLASTTGSARGVSSGLLASPLGYALLRRWRWLKESEDRGIPYAEAEAAFEAAIDRDRDALIGTAKEQDRRRAAAIAETEKKRKGDDVNVAAIGHKFFDEAMAAARDASS